MLPFPTLNELCEPGLVGKLFAAHNPHNIRRAAGPRAPGPCLGGCCGSVGSIDDGVKGDAHPPPPYEEEGRHGDDPQHVGHGRWHAAALASLASLLSLSPSLPVF